MQHKRITFLRIAVMAPVLALVLLSGCKGLIRYGEAVRYPPYAWREKIDVVMPPGAPYISQQFTGPYEDRQGGHLGLDVWEAIGTPVLAAASGTVIESYYEPMYGNRIIIRHGNDEQGRSMTTVYKHLDARMAEVGATIRRGQQIGTLGDTGLLSALPHLHFEVRRTIPRKGDVAFDPHLFWIDGVGRVTCYEASRRHPETPFRITYPVRCVDPR